MIATEQQPTLDHMTSGFWANDGAEVAYNQYATTIREMQAKHKADFEKRFQHLAPRTEDCVQAQQALSGDPTIAYCIKKMVELRSLFWCPMIVMKEPDEATA